jgi:hypothetical protein
MKSASTLIISCLLSFTASSQQWKLTSNYSLALPQQQMGKNIQAAHSVQAGVLYQVPQLKNLSVGFELGLGLYAHEKINQTFKFDNNTTTVAPVNYNSNVFNINLQSRFDLLDETQSPVVPYISAKAGLYNFFSNITIEDPQDPNGCHPLDRKNIINDKTLYWSAGAGLQVNPAVFTKRSGRLMIDISANTIRGGTLEYINTKNLMDAQDMMASEGKPLMMKFINASTQSIHEHTVAQVYTTPLRFIEFRAGITAKLGRIR